MPRLRKLIRTKLAGDRLGCSSKTIKRGAYDLKLYPNNPDKPTIWMVEEMAVNAILEKRLKND